MSYREGSYKNTKKGSKGVQGLWGKGGLENSVLRLGSYITNGSKGVTFER